MVFFPLVHSLWYFGLVTHSWDSFLCDIPNSFHTLMSLCTMYFSVPHTVDDISHLLLAAL